MSGTVRWGRFEWDEEKSEFNKKLHGLDFKEATEAFKDPDRTLTKGGKYMKKKRNIDPNRPIGKLTVIPDFLPPPEDLFPKSELQKITIIVDKNTVLFFKKTASKHGQKYQRMMREVLKGYAKKYGT